MDEIEETLQEVEEELVVAAAGAGPLLQRDYWGVIANCTLKPTEVAELVASRFPEFAPEALCRFEREGDATGPIQVGDVLTVRIRWAWDTSVVCVHRNANSLTLATVSGHPEAGRITFGAYRNERGDVVFHIRSRARAGSGPIYLGYLVGGSPMQTNTWTDFVDRVALTTGDGVVGAIHAETTEAEEEPEDCEEPPTSPTYLATGD